MPELPLAVEIADACRDAEIIADVEATAKQLHNSHPEADVQHEDVVAALTDVAGERPPCHADENAPFLPLTVRFHQSVQQIANLREALEFLRHWPTDRQGPVFICAERSCHAAAAGNMPMEQARQSFVSFAKTAGILAASCRRSELNHGVLSSFVGGADFPDGTRAPSIFQGEAEWPGRNLVHHYRPIGPAAIAAAVAAAKKRKPKTALSKSRKTA